MSDVPMQKASLLAVVFDILKGQVEIALHKLKPESVFFDFAYWLPGLAVPLGIKCIFFSLISGVSSAYFLLPSRKLEKGQHFTELDLIEPPPERRKEDGWFTRESVWKAVKLAMDEGSEVGGEIRANHPEMERFLVN
ncbi:hypothetical protein IFM89_010885 [Coptis chinensis]|uniref:Uncharacterized protein n=1 Tax=Coptis chinensis TaxID=261450 RepID=A0A835LUJ2_9MAGN|nr:hypothetical protein IFM89_010885 [Coptis chinensis]